MFHGELGEISGKYVIKGIQLPIFQDDIYYQLIPNDIVSYEINTNGYITIINLIERREQISICIIRGIRNGKCYLFYPMLSSIYNPSIDYSMGNIHDRLLCQISKDEIKILKNYGSIDDRTKDSVCFIDLYIFSSKNSPKLFPLKERGKSLLGSYKDLRSLTTINIDPVKSKDFDDAFSLDLDNNRIYIHIVDIYYHLLDNMDLWEKACSLGFTLYLIDTNYPIFPREKVENEWTLLENKDRRVITCEIEYNPEDLTIINYEIYQSTIRISKRYNYEEVNETFDNWNFLQRFISKWAKPSLFFPNFNMETENGLLKRYWKEDNMNFSHKLIETLMIMTNIIICQHLMKYNIKIPQRFHDKLIGYKTSETIGIPEIDTLIQIKCYSRAKYELYCHGHFGLKIDEYTHFTSPMRRMIDIIIHTMLVGIQYDERELEKMLDYWNNRKDLTDKIKHIEKLWKILDYLKDKDIVFTIYIYKINKFGICYYIPDIMLDGFIHISKIKSGIRWIYENSILSDKDSKYNIAIGQEMKCKIININIGTLSWDVHLIF